MYEFELPEPVFLEAVHNILWAFLKNLAAENNWNQPEGQLDVLEASTGAPRLLGGGDLKAQLTRPQSRTIYPYYLTPTHRLVEPAPAVPLQNPFALSESEGDEESAGSVSWCGSTDHEGEGDEGDQGDEGDEGAEGADGAHGADGADKRDEGGNAEANTTAAAAAAAAVAAATTIISDDDDDDFEGEGGKKQKKTKKQWTRKQTVSRLSSGSGAGSSGAGGSSSLASSRPRRQATKPFTKPRTSNNKKDGKKKEMLKTSEETVSIPEDDDNNLTCRVCLEAPATMITIPCGCLSACAECAAEMDAEPRPTNRAGKDCPACHKSRSKRQGFQSRF